MVNRVFENIQNIQNIQNIPQNCKLRQEYYKKIEDKLIVGPKPLQWEKSKEAFPKDTYSHLYSTTYLDVALSFFLSLSLSLSLSFIYPSQQVF